MAVGGFHGLVFGFCESYIRLSCMEDSDQRMGIAVRKNSCDIDALEIRFHKSCWVTADSWVHNVQGSRRAADAGSEMMALPDGGMHSLPNRDSIESYTVSSFSIWSVVHGGNGLGVYSPLQELSLLPRMALIESVLSLLPLFPSPSSLPHACEYGSVAVSIELLFVCVRDVLRG